MIERNKMVFHNHKLASFDLFPFERIKEFRDAKN